MSFLASSPTNETILYEGTLSKRGKLNTSWKKRWFTLDDKLKLKYYENYESAKKYGNKTVLGTIDLLQVLKIEISLTADTELSSIPKHIKIRQYHRQNKDNRSFLIYITTANRTYKLSANDNDSFLKWLKYLSSELYSDCEIIFESFLEVNSRKYYCVLTSNKYFKYYNNERRDILYGFINLNKPQISLTLQTMDNCFELTPDIHTKEKLILYTKDCNIFDKWSDYLREKQYKNLMVNDENLCIESESENTEENTLNLSGQNLQNIPLASIRNIARINKLIVTNNKLSSLKALKYFRNLHTLQLDRNELRNINDFPKLRKLKTLWLNNNRLQNINSLLVILKRQCPKLEYLSLLFNPLCGAMNEEDNKEYRLTLIYHLPNLKVLDTERVDNKERHQSIYGMVETDEEDEDQYQGQEGDDSIMDYNLFRYKSSKSWSTMSLEQHEEELKNQLKCLVKQTKNLKSRLYE